MHAIAGMFYARASVTPKRVLRSLRTQKVLTTVRQIARATSGAIRTSRRSKGTISSGTRAWSGMTTLKPQQRSTHVLEQARRRIMGSLLCRQNMLATAPQIVCATLRRATPLAHSNAPSRALYGPGVSRLHPQPQKRSTCVLPTRSKASWDSFARKRCSQRQHLLDNARNSRGRATNRSPIQMRYLVRYTGPEWRAHAHNRSRKTPHARALNTQISITGSLCTQTVCARNMRHLKTLGRATNLSSSKIHHIERHTCREWRIHPHMHRNTPHA